MYGFHNYSYNCHKTLKILMPCETTVKRVWNVFRKLAIDQMKLATLENFDKIHEEVAKVMQQADGFFGSLFR